MKRRRGHDKKQCQESGNTILCCDTRPPPPAPYHKITLALSILLDTQPNLKPPEPKLENARKTLAGPT